MSLNPAWEVQAGAVAPDGDVFIEDEQVLNFRVPSCEVCGGILKPDATFFGDTVKKEKVQFVHDRLAESDAVLVVGSSLQVIFLNQRHNNTVLLLSVTFFEFFFFSQRFTQGTGFCWQPVTGNYPLPS